MSPSLLQWLDFSESEQRRAHEILQLFTTPDSRDELGIGTIRDVISNALFPGVSVVQTRARYFLFIPWLYLKAEKEGKHGQAQRDWVDTQERRLIETLRKGGDEYGLIGKQKGEALKQLPSAIYWGALERYRIRLTAGAPSDIPLHPARSLAIDDGLTERNERTARAWSEPPDPPGEKGDFPDKLDRLDFTLTPKEGEWLRDRIQLSCPDSFLGWLMAEGKRSELLPNAEDRGPWAEPWVKTKVPPDHQRTLQHAKLFSLVMVGAALLYNQMLAEKKREKGFASDDTQTEDYARLLRDWRSTISTHEQELQSWNVDDFWHFVEGRRQRPMDLTKKFVNEWIDRVRRPDLETATSDEGARLLIEHREKQQKGGQARLENDKLLKHWGGNAGTGRLDFRWGQVREMLNDIHGKVDNDARA